MQSLFQPIRLKHNIQLIQIVRHQGLSICNKKSNKEEAIKND